MTYVVEALGLAGDLRLLLRLLGPWRLRALARLLDLEPDPVLRLDAVQRLGEEEVMTALGRPPLSEDEANELYQLVLEPQPTLLIKVRDPAIVMDGARRHRCPAVPPHVASAREAVARIPGSGDRQYCPGIGTSQAARRRRADRASGASIGTCQMRARSRRPIERRPEPGIEVLVQGDLSTCP